MAVARSYENYEIKGEAFKESGKWYVNVITPKGIKKVRWYSDAERAAQDRKAGITQEKDIMNFNARHAFGFDEAGYITIYKGNEDEVRDWARATWPPKAWYNLTFGFFTPSKMEVSGLPNTIKPIKLTWDEVKDGETKMKPHDVVRPYVASLKQDGSNQVSTFQGEIGKWIERDLVVCGKSTIHSSYGDKYAYTFMDASKNVYEWVTATKDYEINSCVSLKMKVKDHAINNNTAAKYTTVVWYCKEM